jgi:acyl-CoA thioesterase FadM
MWRTQARLVVSALLAKARPAQRVLSQTSAGFVVKPWEVDLNGHLNYSIYPSYFARAQGQHFLHTQYIGKLYLRGFSNVIATSHINYLRPIRPLARFSIDTCIAGCDEKYVYCEQSLRDAGTLAATSIQRMVIVDRRGLKVAPKDVLPAILGSEVMPPPPPYRGALRSLVAAQQGERRAGDAAPRGTCS